jgi:hypothetical protein
MAGLDLYATQQVISAHIKAEFPNYTVEEDDVIDDNYLLRLDNNVKPFIFLRWGQLERLANDASFGGVRHDEYVSSVDVAIIAPSANIARQISNMVYDKLIGWRVPNGGVLTPGGGGTWAARDDNGKPHVYISSKQFTYPANFENVSQNVTP